MDLSLELVYKKNLKRIGTTGMYPSKDNCYRVEVSDSEDGLFDFICEYCPKPVYYMWVSLSKIKNTISKTQMMEIINVFNEYGTWKYDESSFDASMNCEDI